MKSGATFLIAASLLAASASAAFAFGTVSKLGQDREHERITRHALACGAHGAAAAPQCFEPRSLNELAGESGTFGGVGAPDNPLNGMLTTDEAHCDNGDYLTTGGYPQNKAAANHNLEKCRAWMNTHMDLAVKYAKNLLTSSDQINRAGLPADGTCSFVGNPAKDPAKCAVLAEFGISLHASQDFYSHSNWVDRPRPGGVAVDNPPGLFEPGPAEWLDLRVMSKPVPDGLITGCFEKLSLISEEKLGCDGRVKHLYLNKDKGQIDPTIKIGRTSRGEVNSNFFHAVEAAIEDTQDKWKILRERLVAKYGRAEGARMICVITHDNPTAATCP